MSNTSATCFGLYFINDTTGFLLAKGTQGYYLKKTSNFGNSWVNIGGGMPTYLGLYIINKNMVYLITTWNGAVAVSRCSDILFPAPSLIFDSNTSHTDIFINDSTIFNSLCNIDSLKIHLKDGITPFTYHINFSCKNSPTLYALSSSSLICTGETATLSAVGANTYSWSSISTSTSIAISPSITTTYTLTGNYSNGCKNIITITQNVSSCIGIDETNNTNSIISVFPNPSDNLLEIKGNFIEKFEIKDVNGKIIFQSNNLNSYLGHKVDVSRFNSGIYFITIYSNGTYFRKKFLISRD